VLERIIIQKDSEFPNYFSELSKKLNMAKHKVEDVINKGLSRDGDRTVNDKMLELDIIIHKTIEDNKEEQNNIN